MGDLQPQHNLFLQAFMWKKIFDSDEVRLLNQKCHDSMNVPVGDWKIFIAKINGSLKPLNMALKKGVDELTGKDYLVLINEADTALSRLSVEYEGLDLEVFKKIVSSIVLSEEGKVSSTTILNFADDINKSQQKKLSRRDVNDILKKFTKSGWLCEKDGHVFFSTRGIVELHHFLQENFPNSITICSLCRKIVLQGASCFTCDKKIHFHCRESFVSKSGNSACLNCKGEFEEP